MITVVKPRESIIGIWGKQQVNMQSEYRLMKYILQMEHEGKVLLHNVVTGQLVVLEEDEAEALKALPTSFKPELEELIKNHYLVQEDYDEYRSVNQLRAICRKQSNGDAINHFVILPTTFCNAHCFYCYESGYPHVHMTEETGRKVIDFIAEHRKDKTVKLAWFGGEPLVGIQRIDQISEGLKKRDIPFFSTMISNGYLFTEEIVRRSADLWNLQRVQITLDGTEEVYNRVKAYVSVQENPFRRVLRNIDLLADQNVQVVIRLNLDYYNKDDLGTLAEELAVKYAGNRHIAVYVSLLYNDQGFEPVHHSVESYVQLLRIHDEFAERLAKLGIGQERRKIPSMQFRQCMADDPHSILIQPDGGFCRCEHENVMDSYGNIEEGIVDQQKLLQWQERVNHSEYCPECSMFPYCYMLQNCMDLLHSCSEEVRANFQNRHKDLLVSIYQKKLEEENNEKVRST